MKKIIVFMLCVLVFGIFGCKKQNAETNFTVGLDDSFPPMGFRDSNNKIVGFDIDLAAEVAKRMNVKLVLRPIDWNSKELELENNNIDCIWNGLSVNPEREEKMLLSKPYLSNRMIIIVKNGSDITEKSQLEFKKVGVQAGSTALRALEDDPISEKVNRSDYENNTLALTDLKIGRIDAVVMDEVVARYQMSKDKGSYNILDESLSSEVYAIAFKKGNNVLKDKVEAILKEMASDGTSDKISQKWFDEVIILK